VFCITTSAGSGFTISRRKRTTAERELSARTGSYKRQYVIAGEEYARFPSMM
jgi:hypothetical protein